MRAVERGDGVAYLRGLPPASVAAVVTDPPWNLGRDYGPTVDDDRDTDVYLRWMRELLRSALTAAGDAVVILPGAANLDTILPLVDVAAGWRQLLWWEPALDAHPGDLEVLHIEREPVLWLRRHAPDGLLDTSPVAAPLRPDPYLRHHPNPKPVELFEQLIRRCVRQEGTIVDPCAGTGSTIEAAARLGRPALGVEIEPRFHAVARERLEGVASAR